jgi:hypothetical protein
MCKNNFNFRQGKVKMSKIILLQQEISINRCYFQFKKERPDLRERDPATMYLFRKYENNLT